MSREKRRGPNEGSIYKRKDGRWTAVVDLGWEDGKRQRKAFYGATYDEVRKRLSKAITDRDRGLPLADDRITVQQFLDQWLGQSVKPTVRQSTYVSYAEIVKLHLGPKLGKTRLSKLTPQQVQRMLNEKREEGLSPARVQRIHAALRRALNIAQRWDLVPRNVATLVDPPRVAREEVETFTEEQTTKFLEAVKGNRLEALYTVALALGLRKGEILGLQWSDIDLDAGTLTVRHALQRVKGEGLALVEPKSERSRRTITLPKYAIDALRNHRLLQKQEARWGGRSWHPSDYVFTTKIGTPLDPSNLDAYYKKLLADAKLPVLKFHSLRHLCATILLRQGISSRVTMEVLGHSQIALTENTYRHVMPALMTDAAKSIDAFLGGKK